MPSLCRFTDGRTGPETASGLLEMTQKSMTELGFEPREKGARA